MFRLSRVCILALLPALAIAASAPVLAQDSPAAQLRGVLLDAEGLPASGYQLGLKSPSGDLYLAPPTGADGAFALDAIPPGSYEVVAFSPDGEEFPVLGGGIVLEPGKVERLEIRLKPTGYPPGRPPEPEPVSEKEPDRGGWFSRMWNSGPGGKAGIVAIVVGAGWGVVELVDDDEKDRSPSN